MIGIRLTDPCYYCGASWQEIRANGCGSEEFSRPLVDCLCEVADRVRRGEIGQPAGTIRPP